MCSVVRRSECKSSPLLPVDVENSNLLHVLSVQGAKVSAFYILAHLLIVFQPQYWDVLLKTLVLCDFDVMLADITKLRGGRPQVYWR